ncbi:MAG: hypothetical protein EHM41_06035 [Chloroflexi bacterium]|nr:MAG: hypothetical protein EHM41_06035 [Chloroflexota bacterium]
MKTGKYFFSFLVTLAFILSACISISEQEETEQASDNQLSGQARSTQSAGKRDAGLPETGAQETIEATPTRTATPSPSATPTPTERPAPIVVKETMYASQILQIPLVTEEDRVIETSDILGDSGIWELRYIIVTEADGDHVPVPLAAMDIVDIDTSDEPGVGDDDLVYSTELSAEEIDNSPSFESKDVEALRGANPQLLQLLGVDNWDELASDHWLDKVEMEPIPEGESGYPILMSGGLLEGEDEGIDFQTVNSTGERLGIIVDFVVNPDRKIIHAVLDRAEAGITVIPIQLVSVDVENHQLVIPAEIALLDTAPTFENRDELPDIRQTGWDEEIINFWMEVIEKNDQ